MIRVLVASSLWPTRTLLLKMFEPDPDLKVAGEACDGLETVSLTRHLRPDLIVMDAQMLQRGGLEATQRIMIDIPTPIVIASDGAGAGRHDIEMGALQAGALIVVRSPRNALASDFAETSRAMILAIKAMASVKLVKRWPDRPSGEDGRARAPVPMPSTIFPPVRRRIVAIAASTGGPEALREVFRTLPADFPLPILVVQHIADGFIGSFVDWLDSECPLRVKIAADGEALAPGSVYVAPEGRHLGLSPQQAILMSHAAPISGFRPSASFLFEQVVKVFGTACICAQLTGMGEDGVAGLAAVHLAGGFVIAQDEASSAVFSMPGRAIAAGLADVVSPVSEIGAQLIHLATL